MSRLELSPESAEIINQLNQFDSWKNSIDNYDPNLFTQAGTKDDPHFEEFVDGNPKINPMEFSKWVAIKSLYADRPIHVSFTSPWGSKNVEPLIYSVNAKTREIKKVSGPSQLMGSMDMKSDLYWLKGIAETYGMYSNNQFPFTVSE